MRGNTVSILVAFLAVVCGVLYVREVHNRDTLLNKLKTKYDHLDLKHSNVLVIGATAGIGKAIALRFARANADVSVVARSVDKGHALVDAMYNISSSINPKSGSGSDAPSDPDTNASQRKHKHAFYAYDVSLVSSARKLAEEYKQTHATLDYLILSPCIATIQGRTETVEGNDVKMTLHYYTRIALVEALSDVLKAGKGRVLSVLSGGVHSPYKSYDTDVALTTEYSIANAANAAGFYTDIAFSVMAEKNPHLTLFHSSPGFVASNWGTEMPSYIRIFIRALQAAVATSTETCAEFMCAPLFDESIPPGFHVRGSRAEIAERSAGIDQAKDIVWGHTRDVLKERSVHV